MKKFYKQYGGFTLIELMIVLVIFSVVMAGLYSAYSASVRQEVKEYRVAESEMEFQIAKSIIERDIAMAGYGLANDYSAVSSSLNPFAVKGTDDNPDTLTLNGTAIGRGTRSVMAWSYNVATSLSTSAELRSWGTTTFYDSSEDLRSFDRVIYMEPNTRKILAASGNNDKTQKTWLFTYPPNEASQNITPAATVDLGTVLYGLQTKPSGTGLYADVPYYTITYSLGGTRPSTCALGTYSLLRSEAAGEDSNPQPVLNCVLDFEVALGLDDNEDGTIDCWDNGGAQASAYGSTTFRTRLKQVKIFVLVQEGTRDTSYTYSNPDTSDSAVSGTNKIRAGDLSLHPCSGASAGNIVTLNDANQQRNYHWRVIAITVTPRNIRQ